MWGKICIKVRKNVKTDTWCLKLQRGICEKKEAETLGIFMYYVWATGASRPALSATTANNWQAIAATWGPLQFTAAKAVFSIDPLNDWPLELCYLPCIIEIQTTFIRMYHSHSTFLQNMLKNEKRNKRDKAFNSTFAA